MAHRPGRIAFSAACICLCVPLAYATMESAALLAQSNAEGATALDVFYAACNTREVVGLLLPLAVAAQCVDILGADLEDGTVSLVLPRLERARGLWTAKVAAALAAALAVMVALWLVCLCIDAGLLGMPLGDGSPAAWLSYEGTYAQAFEADSARFQIMPPLPASWSMLAFQMYAVVTYACLYAGVCLLCSALCAGARTGRAAWTALGAAGISIWAVHGVFYLWNAEWLEEILTRVGIEAPSLYAQPLYWLMPVGYRLGAGFFSGGVTMTVDGVAEWAFGNMPASTAVIPALLLCAAWALGAWRTRDGWGRLL